MSDKVPRAKEQDRLEEILEKIDRCVKDISNSLEAGVKLHKKHCKDMLCLAGELNDIIGRK